MTLHDAVLTYTTTYPLLTLILLPLVYLLLRSFHRIYLHPLSRIPSTPLAVTTSLYLHLQAYLGREASTLHSLHARYGPILRIAPNQLDISDADAVHSIYVAKGGFLKAGCYANFDIEGHTTVFSATDVGYRAPRAKAVGGLFAGKALRDSEGIVGGCVERFLGRLDGEKTGEKGGVRGRRKERVVNVLNLARSLAVDVVSSHLFRENYDGIGESDTDELSAAGFVDAYVAVGRFFYLPNWVFAWVDWFLARYWSSEETEKSMALVDKFVGDLVEKTSPEATTYAGRLLAIGLQKSEVIAQCKDLIFAGTDSSGMNLATIMRNLALYPDKYARLKEEVRINDAKGDDAVPAAALPYLNAIVKESLRISMANPTRLPRVVPPGGWTFKENYIPAGTIVGCSAYELHFNAAVFPSPHSFIPERWLDEKADLEAMNKHWFAFGAGSRACIARSLAMVELIAATEGLGRSGVLDGAQVNGEVRILEWFNSKVVGERIELIWSEEEGEKC